jgi:hypothetical protein
MGVFFYTTMTGMVGGNRNAYLVNVLRLPEEQTSLFNVLTAVIPFILNFFIVALVLFSIVKIINKFREEHKELGEKLANGKLTKAQKQELKANGINKKDKEAVAAYFEAKKKAEEEAAAAKAAEEAEKARLDRLANPTTEDLLKSILEELKKD